MIDDSQYVEELKAHHLKRLFYRSDVFRFRAPDPFDGVAFINRNMFKVESSIREIHSDKEGSYYYFDKFFRG